MGKKHSVWNQSSGSEGSSQLPDMNTHPGWRGAGHTPPSTTLTPAPGRKPEHTQGKKSCGLPWSELQGTSFEGKTLKSLHPAVQI